LSNARIEVTSVNYLVTSRSILPVL